MIALETAVAKGQRPAPERPRAIRLLLVTLQVGIIILLMLSFLTLPNAPPATIPAAFEADASLTTILSHAHEHGLQFGNDLAYTYGPLGFLIFFEYSPYAAGAHLAVNVVLCSLAAAGLWWISRRLSVLWAVLFLGAFVWVAPNSQPRTDLVMNAALLCWGLLCVLETGPRLVVAVLSFGLLAAFSALAKVSFFFVVVFSVGLLVLDLLSRGRWRLGLVLLLASTGLFLLGWVACGQNVAHVPAFISNGLAMVRGYNAALGWEELEVVRGSGLLLGFLLAALLLIRVLSAFPGQEANREWRRVLLLAWLAGFAFSNWKHGLVRGQSVNILMSFGLIPVLALALEALPCDHTRPKRWGQVVAVVCWVIPLVVLQNWFFPSLGQSLLKPLTSLREHFECVAHPSAYFARMDELLAVNRRAAQLPRIREAAGSASVDVFGRHQAYAVFNDLNYHPRPVPQSYAACSAALMRLNEQFFLSNSAPAYVLFELTPLERKLPPLEDSLALRALLVNYEPVTKEGPFLLLKRRAIEKPRVSLLRESTANPSQPINLPVFSETDVWLEIQLEPTWRGRLRQFFFRPPTVRLAAWSVAGKKLLTRQRAPAPMLAAGFLVSPLLLTTDDVLDLYTSNPVKRPVACSVELLPGEERFWKTNFQYRLYKVENRLGRCAPRALAAQLKHAAALLTTENSPGSNSVASSRSRVRPFTLFHSPRWRADRPPPGNWQETLAFWLFLVGPLLTGMLVLGFARGIRQLQGRIGWRLLVLGNTLVLSFLFTSALLAGEIYFRFFYDTTDSLGYTRVCERWVQRHWHINAAGCRDDTEYAAKIAPGKRRVTFIGDSFTAGHGVKNVGDRFPNLLRSAHPNWEVHVLANVGLDTGAEQILLNRALAKGYQLDQVVLVYCLNDVSDLLLNQGENFDQTFADLDRNWLTRNSYCINLLYHHYKASRNERLKNYFSFVRDAYRGPAWEQQKQRLTAFRDAVQSHGGKLSVVTFPFLNALRPNYDYQFVHDELDEFWRSLGVPHLDLLTVYTGLPAAELTINRYDAHPNERANRLAAEALNKFLESLGSAGAARAP